MNATQIKDKRERSRRRAGIHYNDETTPATSLEAAEMVALTAKEGCPVFLDNGAWILVEDLSLKAVKLGEGYRYTWMRKEPTPYSCVISRDTALWLTMGETIAEVIAALKASDEVNERERAKDKALHEAWANERAVICHEQHLEPSKDFCCWLFERDHPGEPLPGFMRDWRDMHLRFENGSHAQSDNATDRQNERDAQDAVTRRLANWRPTRTEAELEAAK